MPRVVVNGMPQEFEPGQTILSVLTRSGIHVPALCDDPRLAPVGACRLCVVDTGAALPVTACTALATDGMTIQTHTRELEQQRRTLLRMLAWNHPAEAALSPLDNPFLAELRAYDLTGELRGVSTHQVDESNPYIRVDMSRCIYCYRCERICNDIQGQFTWRIWGRGADLRIVPDSGTTLRESSCVSCGACVDTCPTGALEDKGPLTVGPSEQWTRTTCPYCGVGCEMQVGTRNGLITEVRPALDAPVNKGHLCSKGRYAFGFVQAPDRVTTPMIRAGGEWRAVSWAEAVEHVTDRLRDIHTLHGPDACGVLGSARMTNEENYLAQKFARVVLGTNNVDCCARVCHTPSSAAMNEMLGAGAATNSFDDIESARTLLVCGSNTTENHPIVGARVRQAARRGANLIVVDPRRTELAEIADIHLRPRTGTNIPLLNAMASTIIEERLTDSDFITSRVDRLADFQSHVAAWPAERAAAVCGVDAGEIRRAARMYAVDRPAMCLHGLGMTEQIQGTETVMCLVNLALLTGNLGTAGAGINPLRGQNNVQGAAHMGCEPRYLTGMAPIDEARTRFEQAWAASIPHTPGLDLMEMVGAAQEGRLKALYAIGYDVLATNPHAARTRSALADVDLLVIQDMFLNETAREFATVFLPAASSFEKDGTFMNSERRIQRVRRVVNPPAQARTDWEILCALAAKMGHANDFAFGSAEQIWDEVRSLWPAGAGISYQRLERSGIQWPCPDEEHPGTPILHTAGFATGQRRAALRLIDYHPTNEATTTEFPLLLVTGRSLYQFNTGTMTGRTPNTVLRARDTLDISPHDAGQHGLRQSDRVVVVSRYGQVELPVNISSALPPGEVFATFHTAEPLVNQVTGDDVDHITHTPQYKVTAVRLTPA